MTNIVFIRLYTSGFVARLSTLFWNQQQQPDFSTCDKLTQQVHSNRYVHLLVLNSSRAVDRKMSKRYNIFVSDEME